MAIIGLSKRKTQDERKTDIIHTYTPALYYNRSSAWVFSTEMYPRVMEFDRVHALGDATVLVAVAEWAIVELIPVLVNQGLGM